MHGEVATDVVAAGELVIAARHLLDPMPRGELSYGPLHEGGHAARKSVYRRLVQLWQARRAITDGDVDLRDARTLLTDLDSILREMRTAATIQQAYTRAERRAMAAAVVAKIRGDAMGLDAQRDAVHRAAADALHALQSVGIHQ